MFIKKRDYYVSTAFGLFLLKRSLRIWICGNECNYYTDKEIRLNLRFLKVKYGGLNLLLSDIDITIRLSCKDNQRFPSSIFSIYIINLYRIHDSLIVKNYFLLSGV